MKKKNAIGGDGRARTEALMIMLTTDEYREVREKSYNVGMPASTWARVELLKKCREEN